MNIKKYFFTGLIILLPVVLTLMIFFFLLDFFTQPFLPPVTELLLFLQDHITYEIPDELYAIIARILALILLCAFVFLLGVISRWFFVRNLIKGTHSLFSRIPILRSVLKVSRDVFAALFAQDGKKAFKRPVMIPFPSLPNHCLGFEVGTVPPECQSKVSEPLTSVFAPTAPHPISGFLFIPKKDIFEIDMTNEEAVKYLVSCGVIVPEGSHESN